MTRIRGNEPIQGAFKYDMWMQFPGYQHDPSIIGELVEYFQNNGVPVESSDSKGIYFHISAGLSEGLEGRIDITPRSVFRNRTNLNVRLEGHNPHAYHLGLKILELLAAYGNKPAKEPVKV